MNKKDNFEEGQITRIEALSQQNDTMNNKKKHSKAYYKLLHTYSTLTSQSKTQPISIHNCGTPLITERLFGCRLNQKPQLSQQIVSLLREKQAKKNLTLLENKKSQQTTKNQITPNSFTQNDDEDDGFQIGQKDELDEVMEIGKKLVGGWMKGFLPGIGLNINQSKR